MEAPEAADGPGDDERQHHQNHTGGIFPNSSSKANTFLCLADVDQLREAKPEKGHACGQERPHKAEEIAVIPAPNAVADPWAVMIKAVNTVVARAAVGRSRRSIDLARFAKLEDEPLVLDLRVH